MIIIEGPDLVGKTTFAEALHRYLSESDGRAEVVRLRRGPPTAHPLDEYETPLLDYRPRRTPGTLDVGRRHVICDRWHLGELVYPRVLGRSTQLDDAVRRHVELFLMARGALVVQLVASADTLAARLASRGDDLVGASHLPALVDAYDEVNTHLARVVLHSGDLTAHHAGNVAAVARNLELAAAPLADFVTYVGPVGPDVLLLGDVRHEFRHGHPAPDDPRRLLPAFGPYPTTSGHYLLSTLDPGVRYGVANACDVDDPHALWRTLGCPPVVALGRRADRRLKMRHGVVPHPQHWRRFYHAYRDEYRRLVLRAGETGDDLAGRRPEGSWSERERELTL